MSAILASDMARELTGHVDTTVDVPVWVPVPTTDLRAYPENTPRPGWISTGTRTVTRRHPCLLDQISTTIRTNTRDHGQALHSTFGSKPAARIDCLALLERINREAPEVAATLGIEPAQHTRRLISAIGANAHHDDDAHAALRSWWITARILTQHDEPPAAPFVPCPDCDQWGTLRVRLEEEIAVCVECRRDWHDEHFRQLCLWAEWAAKHMHGTRHWVPAIDHGYTLGYGMPDYDDLGYVVECPECRTERYQRAVREANRLRKTRRYRRVC